MNRPDRPSRRAWPNGGDVGPGRDFDGPTLWLDVRDFCDYARAGNTNVAGIQRVVANLIIHGELAGCRVVPVIAGYEQGVVWQPDRASLETFVDAMQAGDSSPDEVSDLVDQVLAGRYEVEPGPGDIFALVGCFWIFPHYDMLVRLRGSGVRICLLVYDLIQLENPEFVFSEATRVFCERFVDILALSDGVLAISDYAARDVTRFLKLRLGLSLPVRAVKLATELPELRRSAHVNSAAVEIAGREFVLCVGTIEVRKNHKLLLQVWERLAAEGVNVPTLVIAGKWGWLVEDLRADIEARAAERPWLRIENGLTDASLAYLYQRCIFTIYPSLAEGWGLPVGESLAYGTPCIAANATSLPEVGGDLVRYIDPHDPAAASGVVRDALSDRVGLAEWTKRIRREYRPRPWSAFCAEFYAAAAELTAENGRSRDRMTYVLSAGRVIRAGNRDLWRAYAAGSSLLTFRMARVSGWHPPAENGAWTASESATLRFQPNLSAGTPVVVHVLIRRSGEVAPGQLVIRVGQGVSEPVPLELSPHLAVARGEVSPDGALELGLDYVPDAPGSARVDRWIEVRALGFARADDADMRLDVLEGMSAEVSRVGAGQPTLPTPAERRRELDEAQAALLRRFLIERAARVRPHGWVTRLVSAWLLRSGRRLFRLGRLRQAERSYRRFLVRNPQRAGAWAEYGRVISERGTDLAALGAFHRALDLAPEDPDLRSSYASALEKAGLLAHVRAVRNGVGPPLRLG